MSGKLSYFNLIKWILQLSLDPLKQSSKGLEPHPAAQVNTLNLETLLSALISMNLAQSSVILCPFWFNTLKIYLHLFVLIYISKILQPFSV